MQGICFGCCIHGAYHLYPPSMAWVGTAEPAGMKATVLVCIGHPCTLGLCMACYRYPSLEFILLTWNSMPM